MKLLRSPLLLKSLPRRAAAAARMTSTCVSAAPRGAFILFEGTDRCGKTTQCTKLLEALKARNLNVELWRFPDRTTALGRMINAYLANKAELDDASIHLVFAANRWEKRAALLDTLNSGITIVMDRYSYSGVAYTSAKGVEGLDMEWCRAPEVGLPAPDLVLYLEISEEASARRGGYGEERYEKADLQRKVAERFTSLRGDNWVVLNADQPEEPLHQQVMAAAEGALAKAAQGPPILRLWDGAPIDPSSSSRPEENAGPANVQAAAATVLCAVATASADVVAGVQLQQRDVAGGKAQGQQQAAAQGQGRLLA